MPYLSQIMLLSVSLFHRIAALAGVAQLVERLTCNEDVVGSTPFTGSIKTRAYEISRPFFIVHGALAAHLQATNHHKGALFQRSPP